MFIKTLIIMPYFNCIWQCLPHSATPLKSNVTIYKHVLCCKYIKFPAMEKFIKTFVKHSEIRNNIHYS